MNLRIRLRKQLAVLILSSFMIFQISGNLGTDKPQPIPDAIQLTLDSVWTNLNPSGNPGLPSARYYHQIAYDSKNFATILFGGKTSSSANQETWVYFSNNNTWEQRNPSGSPSSRFGHSMTFNQNTNTTIIFGGYSGSNYLQDMLQFDYQSNSWSDLLDSNPPTSRANATMAYDSFSSNLLLYGGRNQSGVISDTWIYHTNTNSWTEITSPVSPESRELSDMAYDPINKGFILYGGLSSFGVPLSDTWFYNTTTNEWLQISAYTNPPALFGHQMSFDLVNSNVVLHGGTVNGISGKTETFRFSFSNGWLPLYSNNVGPALFGADMIFDVVNGSSILFGGFDTVELQSTYSFSHISISYKPPIGVPYVQHSTLLSGTYRDTVRSGVMRSDGSFCFAGDSESTDYISNLGGHNGPSGPSAYESFITCLDNDGGILGSRFFGGIFGYEVFHDLAINSNNELIAVGDANSDVPATIGYYVGGSAGIALHTNGPNSALSTKWSMMVDTSGLTFISDAEVDASGNVYMVGFTDNNIVTLGGISGGNDTTSNGGYDGFLLKFNPLGQVVWGTYIGDLQDDFALGLKLDPSGDIYVAGKTESPNFPTSPGAYDNLNEFGEAFLQKYNSTGYVLWSTMIGGDALDELNWNTITLDNQGNVFIGGITYSTNFPTTVGSYQTSFNGGDNSGFVSKFSPSGNLIASTFVGGNLDDQTNALAIDSNGNVIIGLITTSTDIEIIDGINTYVPATNEISIINMSNSLQSISFSTYLGSFMGNDEIHGIIIDQNHRIIVYGTTENGYHFPGLKSGQATPSGIDGFVSFIYPDLIEDINIPVETQTTTVTEISISGETTTVITESTIGGETVTITRTERTTFIDDISRTSESRETKGYQFLILITLFPIYYFIKYKSRKKDFNQS